MKINENIIKTFCEQKPKHLVSKLIALIGIKNAMKIFKEKNFQGKLFYIPTISSLKRIGIPFYIQKQLDNLNGEKKKKKIKELAGLFDVPGSMIKKMEKTGRYFRR